MGWSWFGQRAVASPASDLPLLAGRYRLGDCIGRGGTAAVHEAIDLRTGATVAAKLATLPMHLPLARRADWLARQQREVAVAKRLSNPDILAVLDAGINTTHVWMVSERVHGHDLTRYGQPNRLLPEPIVLRLGARVADALAFAHRHGVVHRDLKPSNVLVDLAHDIVKLADFGAARVEDAQITRTGMILGTPMYMAPEQLAGTPASPESDTYALGVMLFELLAGKRPHQAETLGELLRTMSQHAAPSLAHVRPDLPSTVITLVDVLLKIDPMVRPHDLSVWAKDAMALAALIERVLDTRQPAAF